jgi:hypothetical protein
MKPGRPETKQFLATRTSRRRFLAAAGVTGAAIAAPYIWVPRPVRAETAGFGRIKHLIYIRLAGGFRFPTAFNADVDAQFNPFGAASSKAAGTEWGVSRLLAASPFLDGADGTARRALGMRPVPEMSNQMVVIPCVDHEPDAGSADGNHGTGLERFLTGYVNGPVGLFTMINYGLRQRYADAQAQGNLILPPFVLGASDMTRGLGKYAAHRPPVLAGTDFDRFGFQSAVLPDWATRMVANYDVRMRDRQHPELRDRIDAYLESRKSTEAYGQILSSPALKIGEDSDELLDGISNTQLRLTLGDGGVGSRIHLALRLFHYGCAAVYMDQGGYDYHSGEEGALPGTLLEVNQTLSALEAVLKRMDHPSGGKYWDHTVVAFGSEFSRTTNGGRFNSARGSDHGGDYATRWMSMPFMGGPIARPGRTLGSTRRNDLAPEGKVYSYRSVFKTLMDGLGVDHAEFVPDDLPFDDLYV